MLDLLTDDTYVKLIWIGTIFFIILMGMLIADFLIEKFMPPVDEEPPTIVVNHICNCKVYNQEEDTNGSARTQQDN